MHTTDIRPSTTVVHKATNTRATILAVNGDAVTLSPWSTLEPVSVLLADFRAGYRSALEPNSLPTFTIEPRFHNPAGSPYEQAVRLAPLDQDRGFVDDEVPLVLRATAEGLPALEAYITALRSQEAWLGRESESSFGDNGRPIATRPGWSVYKASEHSSKRYPMSWFSVTVSPSSHDAYDEMVNYPSLTVRDEAVALQVTQAVCAGHLTLER